MRTYYPTEGCNVQPSTLIERCNHESAEWTAMPMRGRMRMKGFCEHAEQRISVREKSGADAQPDGSRHVNAFTWIDGSNPMSRS